MKKLILAAIAGGAVVAGTVLGVSAADAAPARVCTISVGDGQTAPCPPALTDNSVAVPSGDQSPEPSPSITLDHHGQGWHSAD